MFTKFVQLEPSSSLLTDGRTDSHDEPNIHFFEICDVPKSSIRYTFIAFYRHVLTLGWHLTTVIRNEITVVVNSYDKDQTNMVCCKRDICETYFEKEFVVIWTFELICMKQGGLPYCLQTLYQIQL